MKTNWYRINTALAAIALLASLVPLTSQAKKMASTNEGFEETLLVANASGTNADFTDANLVNPWGVVSGDKSIWVNNNGTGTLTTYSSKGKPFKSTVSIPGPINPGTPTGLALNDSDSFVLTNSTMSGKHGPAHAPADFLIATEDGRILAWSQSLNMTSAVVVIDGTGSGAIYKGIAIVQSDTNNASFIYAANFASGNIDVFDGNFNYVTSFTDSSLPLLYAPFNIRNIQGRVFVTFALKEALNSTDDEAGPGNGFVDIFDADGTMLRQFAANGALNSPWGLALAPDNFGRFSNALLVGNFGDGRINAYDLLTGKFLGDLKDSSGNELIIPGLWGLDFDSEESHALDLEYSADVLYFTSGPQDESGGVFGTIQPLSPDLSATR